MSERDQSQPNRVLPWLLGTASVVLGGAAVAFVVRPDLYYSFKNQIDNPFEPTGPTTVASAPSLPGTTPSPSETSRLGHGKGSAPVSFRWELGTLTMATDTVQATDSIFTEPQGATALAWNESMMGACAEKGNVALGLHSSPEAGKALIPPDIVKRLGRDGVGSLIELTTANGTKCDYEVEGFDSVAKFGDGPGTYVDYLEHNPSGKDLRNPSVEAGLVLTSCDEREWDADAHTSVNNVVIRAKLVSETPPTKK